MAFIHEQPKPSYALAVTITREVHIKSEKHERKGSMADLISPGAVQIEKPKHDRWKANPHPDNIVLPRKAAPKKKQAQKGVDLNPAELTKRLNEHLRQVKLRENDNASLTPELREMDWDKLRRHPRFDHSRVGSRLEIRKERQPTIEPEQPAFYTGPRSALPLPRREDDALDAYATYSQFSPRMESGSAGLYQHSQFKGTPMRKNSDATATDFYTESIESLETSTTSSRGTGGADRIKSFLGLPPLLFQTHSNGLFNTETTLSLASTFEKLELAMTNTSQNSDTSNSVKSFAGTFGRDAFGGWNSDTPPFDREQEQRKSERNQLSLTSTVNSNRTTRTDLSGETSQAAMRQSAFPQDQPLLPELSEIPQRNIHPLHRVPSATSEQDFPCPQPPQRQEPLAILALNEALPRQPLSPPLPLRGGFSYATFHPSSSSDKERGRSMQPRSLSPRRSVSSSDRTQRISIYKPIKDQVSYTYWRQSRPESWGPGDDQHHEDQIDEYYRMDENEAAATSRMRQPSDAAEKLSRATMPMPQQPQPGPLKRVFGVFGVFGGGPKNSNKATTEKQATRSNEPQTAIAPQEGKKHYNLPAVLPDDFPLQRKNFLGAFSSKR